MNLTYPVILRPLTAEEGGGYLAEFPDLPGCIADGKTPKDALMQAEDALKSWIKTARDVGDAIPQPSTSEKYSGQWRLRIPKSLHASLALWAKIEGVSLNMLAASLLAEGVGRHKMLQTKKHAKS